jgi:hypothetical protein
VEGFVDGIATYGFPIMAALGLGYFIYYIWIWVTQEVNPVIEESHMTLIDLIDKVRMLDNDLIRLETKLTMLLRQRDDSGINYEEDITRINDDDYTNPVDRSD